VAVVIEQRFPLGRFHATRWKQNPFEDPYGEWPPSPWRLLRALLARWFQYTRETGDDDTEKRDDLLRALAGELPAFQLPAATWRGQELRQYQPTALEPQHKYKRNPKTKKNELDYSFRQVSSTLSADTYRSVGGRDRLVWVWRQTRLTGEQEGLLAGLLRRIHYFGRAESLTVMRITESSAEPNCVLRTEGSMTSVPVLVHSPDQPLDIDLMLALTVDKRIANRPLPPGAALYQAELPAVPLRKPVRRQVVSPPLPQVVRFALDSAVLPLVTETLPVAEATRRCLMGAFKRTRLQEHYGGRIPNPLPPDAPEPKSRVLSGKEWRVQEQEYKPVEGHRHAYYLPTAEDNDNRHRLTHLTLIARDGFGREEMQAIHRLRQIKPRGRDNASHPLRVLLLGYGRLDEYRPRPLGPSREWVSATPYIATRVPRDHGRHATADAPFWRIRSDDELARAREQGQRLPRRVLADPHGWLESNLREQVRDVFGIDVENVSIEPMIDGGAYNIASRWRPIQFKRFRSKRTDDGGRRLAGAFRITFPEPVHGPIALGHSAHFGMGLFVLGDQ